ncbi:hypothetical protein [Georgenia sp. SUBG003]|uniref:hypothetical protein n=1 Tax=Georgenia sp. SUBG003 TaxID=1497974 RepID=UPI003AB5AC32
MLHDARQVAEADVDELDVLLLREGDCLLGVFENIRWLLEGRAGGSVGGDAFGRNGSGLAGESKVARGSFPCVTRMWMSSMSWTCTFCAMVSSFSSSIVKKQASPEERADALLQ